MRSTTPLTGQVVLVTGAARGLGEGIARRAAARGARVSLVGLEPERLATVTAEIVAVHGPDAAAWFEADVTDYASLESAALRTKELFGGIDVVVANAGIISFGLLMEHPVEAFERVIEVNLLGVYRTLRATLPFLVDRRGYALVVSSMAAAVHPPLQAHYAASKAGVAALANSLRLEVRGAGVGVGVAHPTFAKTDMMKQTHADPAGQALWGGNSSRGLWAMVEPERVVTDIVALIERRGRRVVIPRRLTPLVLAPGIFTPLLDRIFTDRLVARATQAGRPVDPEPSA